MRGRKDGLLTALKSPVGREYLRPGKVRCFSYTSTCQRYVYMVQMPMCTVSETDRSRSGQTRPTANTCTTASPHQMRCPKTHKQEGIAWMPCSLVSHALTTRAMVPRLWRTSAGVADRGTVS